MEAAPEMVAALEYRTAAVHGVVGVAEAEIKHLPGHVRLTNPQEIPDGKFVPGW